MIIFLNGTSSSGKSEIARQIMHQSERPFLYYSIDHFVNFWIDEKFVAFEDEPKGWFFKQHLTDSEYFHHPDVQGPDISQLHWDMIEALMVFIQKGYDLIIDEVIWNIDIFEHFIRALKLADKTYLINIVCDLIECERREAQRDDRFKGLARSLYYEVMHALTEYDLEIDTTSTSAKDCASVILQFIETNPSPQALNQYLKKAKSIT